MLYADKQQVDLQRPEFYTTLQTIAILSPEWFLALGVSNCTDISRIALAVKKARKRTSTVVSLREAYRQEDIRALSAKLATGEDIHNHRSFDQAAVYR